MSLTHTHTHITIPSPTHTEEVLVTTVAVGAAVVPMVVVTGRPRKDAPSAPATQQYINTQITIGAHTQNKIKKKIVNPTASPTSTVWRGREGGRERERE